MERNITVIGLDQLQLNQTNGSNDFQPSIAKKNSSIIYNISEATRQPKRQQSNHVYCCHKKASEINYQTEV